MIRSTPCLPFTNFQLVSHSWIEMGDHQGETGTHSPTFSYLPSSLHPVTVTSIQCGHTPWIHLETLTGFLPYSAYPWDALLTNQLTGDSVSHQNLNNSKSQQWINECASWKEILIYFPNCSIKEIIKMIIHENWVVFIFIIEETRRLNLLEMTC